MSFYEDMEKSLLEAIEMDKGNLPVKERVGMPVKTLYIADSDKDLIDKLIEIRKNEEISQEDLARMAGSTQQAISRLEKKTHSPSLKLFSSIVDAMGYKVQLVKKEAF